MVRETENKEGNERNREFKGHVLSFYRRTIPLLSHLQKGLSVYRLFRYSDPSTSIAYNISHVPSPLSCSPNAYSLSPHLIEPSQYLAILPRPPSQTSLALGHLPCLSSVQYIQPAPPSLFYSHSTVPPSHSSCRNHARRLPDRRYGLLTCRSEDINHL